MAWCGLDYTELYGICMVYISLSFDVLDAIKTVRLIHGPPSLTVAHDKRMKIGYYFEGTYVFSIFTNNVSTKTLLVLQSRSYSLS